VSTATEVIASLTGYDEIAIEQTAGRTIEEMAGTGRDLQLTRSLAAVLVSREQEIKYAEAYKQVMGKRQSELGELFEDEPDDAFPDEPDSEAGKGESP